MEFIRNFPLFTIVLSLFSGVLCMLLPARNARNYTRVYECVLMGLVSAVLFYTVRTGQAFTYVMGEFPAPWGNEIRAGILEALIALVFLIIMFVSLIAGWHFLTTDIDGSKINLYFTLVNLLTAALMAIIWTNDIFTGYVFLEILTLTSCGILIVRELGRTTLAAVRYMIMNLLGSGLFLMGVVLLYGITGQLLMVPMQETVSVISHDPREMMTLILSLMILTIGLSIKSGLFPFHFWMPDTYGWATPSSAAILSSLVSKAYIFLLFKIYFRCIGIGIFEQMPISKVLFVLGLGGMFFGSVSALLAANIDRMIAFSSAAQIGYIFMGIGLGGIEGYTAAMFHIIAHSLTKSLLFLTAPRLAEVSGSSLLFSRITGSALKRRDAGLFFLAGSLSMIGIPLFAGFSSKLMFAFAAVSSGSERKWLLTMVMLAVSAVLNALYFIRTLIRIYTLDRSGSSGKRTTFTDAATGVVIGDTADQADVQSKGFQADYVIPCAVLVAVNVFLGLFSWVVVGLIERGLSMFG